MNIIFKVMPNIVSICSTTVHTRRGIQNATVQGLPVQTTCTPVQHSPLQSMILFVFADTQEAPKSLSLDSSSSLESLTSLDGDDGGMRARSPPLLTSSMLIPPPPLPFVSPRPAPPPLLLPGHRTSGGAFTSYVRRRGEPDGRTACAGETGGSGVASNKTVGGGCGSAAAPTVGKVQYCDALIQCKEEVVEILEYPAWSMRPNCAQQTVSAYTYTIKGCCHKRLLILEK